MRNLTSTVEGILDSEKDTRDFFLSCMFPFTDGMREEMVKGMFPANTCSKLTIETV